VTRRDLSVRGRRWLIACAVLGSAACSRAAPDATPDGVVHLWLERMETSTDDPRAAREAYALLGPASRSTLEDRAARASRVQGRRVEPYEMLAEGRFGLKFRPKTMSATVTGDQASVEVMGSDPAAEHATVHCTRERPGEGWRIEPGLPDITALPRWRDGG
jgi:hypothetical protein